MKFFSYKMRVFILGFVALICVSGGGAKIQGREVVDKTVAVVSDGVRAELITYSDLLWQLALQPGAQLENPRSDEMNQALQTLINQRLFTLEAERLPRTAPGEKEILDEINTILTRFPSAAVFEARLKQVGFESVKDDAFERLIAQRVATEKYVDFRFASFVVITGDDETKYYRDIFVPAFRQKSPGVLVPSFEEKQTEIHRILTREKVASGIDSFLDEAKRRAVVEILIEV